jgi:hypothetical protein
MGKYEHRSHRKFFRSPEEKSGFHSKNGGNCVDTTEHTPHVEQAYPDPESYPRSESGTLLTPADRMYDDLPVLMVDDYAQLSRQFLVDAYETISQEPINVAKLKSGYWKAQIEQSQSPIN